jgi:hypothetical protein
MGTFWLRIEQFWPLLCKLEKRGDEIKRKSSPLKLLSQSQPNFAEMILGWSSSKIVSGISELRPRWPPQPPIVNLVAILVGSREHWTQFWKGAIQGSFHQSFVAIGPVVSEEKIFVSNVPDFQPRWPPS